MKNIKFVIKKENVYKHIFTASAYTARAREAMGIPRGMVERMVITADDKEAINPLIDNAINEAYGYIARYFANSNVNFTQDNDGGYYAFDIGTPDNYPGGNSEKLAQCVESYIANSVLQHWYASIKPDEGSLIAVQAQNNAATMQLLLTQREKPTSTT